MADFSSEAFHGKRFTFKGASFPDSKFAVVSFRGYEAISRLYRFEIDLATDDSDIDGMINKPADFAIRGDGGRGKIVHYRGIITDFEQSRRVNDLVLYRAVLMPRLFTLTGSRFSEVYLDEKTVPEIITQAMKNCGLTTNDFQMNLLSSSYRGRSYVCQYDETCFDFVSRLMEREGIYYYFQQNDEQEQAVMTDDRNTHSAAHEVFRYGEKGEKEGNLSETDIHTLVMKQKTIPARLVLKDYNYRKATLDLTVTEEVSASGMGEIMLYGENYRTPEEGKALAKVRAQEQLCREKIFVGESSAIGLVAGYFITLEHHYRQSFNGDYLVTEVRHEGAQAWAFLAGFDLGHGRENQEYYYNTFTLIPASQQFRPERLTPKPRISGTMNAHIDAEGEGQYAELDDFGRYKVKLPFDKTDKPDGKASAWLRMATPYAGTDHGMHFPLLKGTEVLLTFIDGDPDLPVIASAVPSSTAQSLVTSENMKKNVIKTAGGNQIVMGDDKSSQHITLWSPFHHSGIVIGSTEKNGGGSLDLVTKGNQNSFTLGMNNTMTVGAKNTATAGTQFNTNVGIIANLNLTQNSSFNITDTITYNVGDTYTLGGGKSYNIKPKASFGAFEEVTFAAGVSAVDNAIYKATGGALALSMIAAAVGVASSLSMGLVSFDDDDKKRVKGQEGIPIAATILGFSLSLAAALKCEEIIKNQATIYDDSIKDGHIGGVVKINKGGVQVHSFGTNLTFDDATIVLQAPGSATATAYSKMELAQASLNMAVKNTTSKESGSIDVLSTAITIGCEDKTNNKSSMLVFDNESITARAWTVDLQNATRLYVDKDTVSIDGPTATGASIAVKNKLIVLKGSANAGVNVTDTEVLIKGLTATFKAADNSITINSGGINLN